MNDITLGALSDAMDVSSLRHQVISNNLANARTPGFHPSDVTFSARVGELRTAIPRPLSGSDGAAQITSGASDGAAQITSGGGDGAAQVTSGGGDGAAQITSGGGTVDPQHEVARMAGNAIQYQSLAQLASARLHLLQSIVHDGRR